MTAVPPPVRPCILLVEDESGIADTVQYVLRSDGFVPVWCPTAGEALAAFAAELPALAILDIGLPDMSGFELFKRLQALPGGAAVPMIFLTARSDEIDRVVGLELGADDYVAKPFSPRELVARVRTILRRSERGSGAAATGPVALVPLPADAPATPAAPLRIDDEKRQIRYYGQPLDLTRYEYRLLCLFVQRPGRVYTRDELLEMVWDDPAASIDRTVDAHVKTLRAKLRAVVPGLDPIRTLRGTGYALCEDLPAVRPA
ncbi:two-component system response regulator CreB [uncultured Xylophilus sp.]|uniref:two-component system response regulator CreB n=1 Tax=uncultured Xylophilus sp. TaxID=296832 RepID=UPI0025D5C0E3|nr:two-component system response regulator CreB [uncultured Xylophilus sp.]